MNDQLNKAQIGNLIIHVGNGKDNEEIGNLLNIAPETAAKYRASFCPSPEPEPEDEAPAPAKKAAAKKAPTKRKR